MKNDLHDLQVRMTKWGTRCFGRDHVFNPAIRALRLAEEAIEFAQSVNVEPEKLHHLIDYVYNKGAGEPAQELGGVMVCAIVAASSIGDLADDVLLREVERVESKSPEHFAARNAVKVEAGFK